MKPAAVVEDNMTRRAATQNPDRVAICSLAVASTLATCLFARARQRKIEPPITLRSSLRLIVPMRTGKPIDAATR
jgi:hypothetical protein